jgi:hypothetical protein
MLEIDIFWILSRLSAVIVLLPIIISLIKFKALGPHLKALSFFLYITAILEVLSLYCASRGINNFFLFHIHTVFEYGCLALVYYYLFNSKIIKRVLLGSIVLVAVFAIADPIFIENIASMNTIPRFINSILLIVLSMLFFYKIFIDMKIFPLGSHPMFWINTGILIYFSGTLFLFIFSNSLMEQSDQTYWESWIIHSILNILLNLFFAIGLWHKRTK